MLAQEAIEIMEKDFKKLKDIKQINELVRDTHTEEYRNLCEAIEALSIVLESARFLHSSRLLTERKKTISRIPYTHLLLETVLYNEEARAIGIEAKS